MAPILIILGIFLLYKLTVDFILPIYRASRKIQEQFRNMQQGQETAREPVQPRPSQPVSSSRNTSDYIDFEEIKD